MSSRTGVSMSGLTDRVNGLQSTCCPDGLLSCPANMPTSCEMPCAKALLAFVADCQVNNPPFLPCKHLHSRLPSFAVFLLLCQCFLRPL